MLLVLIGLLPATIFGIWNFRHENAWILVVVTTVSAVLAEFIYEKLMHKPITINSVLQLQVCCWHSICRLHFRGGWGLSELCSPLLL